MTLCLGSCLLLTYGKHHEATCLSKFGRQSTLDNSPTWNKINSRLRMQSDRRAEGELSYFLSPEESTFKGFSRDRRWNQLRSKLCLLASFILIWWASKSNGGSAKLADNIIFKGYSFLKSSIVNTGGKSQEQASADLFICSPARGQHSLISEIEWPVLFYICGSPTYKHLSVYLSLPSEEATNSVLQLIAKNKQKNLKTILSQFLRNRMIQQREYIFLHQWIQSLFGLSLILKIQNPISRHALKIENSEYEKQCQFFVILISAS